MTAVNVDAAALLALARSILTGSTPLPRAQSARAAVVLTRQALELIIDGLYAGVSAAPARPSMRSKLIIVRELVSSATGTLAASAWDGLSRASHHHAYELQPSALEVSELITAVHKIALTTGSA